MSQRRRRWVGVIVPVFAALFVLAAVPSARHLRLVKAEPAVDGTIASAPSAIRLYFSQEPQIKGTSVRLTDAAEKTVEMGEPLADATDGRIVSAAVKGAMSSGRYTVAWRAMAADGHIVRGEFHFAVKSAE